MLQEISELPFLEIDSRTYSWRCVMTILSVVAGENVPQLEDVNHEISSFNIGTRKSRLAVIQTELVVKALAASWPDYKYTIKARDTAAGDIDKVTPFKDMPVKNLWTHELETLLLEKQLDLLVHSLKGWTGIRGFAKRLMCCRCSYATSRGM